MKGETYNGVVPHLTSALNIHSGISGYFLGSGAEKSCGSLTLKMKGLPQTMSLECIEGALLLLQGNGG